MYTVMENGQIANESGQIAVRYNQTIQKYVKIGNREYVFVVTANISLAWIHPDDLQRVLDMKRVCCGGSLNKVCHLASELDVKRWTGVSIW